MFNANGMYGMGGGQGQGGGMPNQQQGMGTGQNMMPGMAGMGAMAGMGQQGAFPQQMMGAGAGMGAMGQQAAGMGAMPNAMQQAMMNPAMQLMYQQLALRYAAVQKLMQQGNMMGGGMGGGMGPGMGMGAGMGMPGGDMSAMGGGMGGPAGMGGGPMGPGPMGGPMGGQGMGPGPQGPMNRGPRPGGPSGGPRGMQGGGGMQQGGNKGGEDPSLYFKTRICNRWKDGQCHNSEACKYAHGEHELRTVEMNRADAMRRNNPQGGPGGPPQQSQDKGSMINMMRKTRLCQEFMNTGQCRYGDNCTFAHGPHELREAPKLGSAPHQPFNAPKQLTYNNNANNNANQNNNQGPKPPRGAIWKTRLCDRFMRTGQCQYGDRCTFAHGEHELKSLNNSNPTNNPNNPGGEPQIGGGSGTPVAYDSPSPKPDQPQDSTQPLSNAPSLTDGGARDAHDSYDQHGGMGHAQSVTEDELGYGGGSGDGEGYKRGREESVEGEGEDGHGVLGSKRLHLEDESGGAVPECKLCARLVEQGRQKIMQAINILEKKEAQKLCLAILAASPRLDQLWNRCSPATVKEWMAKTEGLTIMEKIEVLHAVMFHAHVHTEDGRTPEGGMGLNSQQYIDKGLPPEAADFIHMVMDGAEGTASMSEYFHMLEVCKQLYGVTDDNYFQISSVVAAIMMGM